MPNIFTVTSLLRFVFCFTLDSIYPDFSVFGFAHDKTFIRSLKSHNISLDAFTMRVCRNKKNYKYITMMAFIISVGFDSCYKSNSEHGEMSKLILKLRQ